MEKRRIETNLSRDVAQMRLIMSTNRQTNKLIKISILLLFDMPNVLYLTVTSFYHTHFECHKFSGRCPINFS